MQKSRLPSLSLALAAVVSVALTACDATPSNGSRDDVVMIGDSIFALSGEIKNQLQQMTGETYRSYYVSGTEMTGGMAFPTIPNQYVQAKQANPNIKTIIMDGGGNDVIISGQLQCGAGINAVCKAYLETEVYQVADKLYKQMKKDGVQNIIYLGYYVTATTEAVANYSAGRMGEVCRNNGVIYIDPRDEFEGKFGLIGVDGIHPSTAGAKILAELIYEELMKIGDY